MKPDAYNLIAADRGLPNGWCWYSVRIIDETTRAILVEGAVPKRLYSKGKNKGWPDWRGAEHKSTIVVTKEEIAARLAKWEADTGQCSACELGQEVRSTGVDGTTYRTCRKCGGSGKAQVAP